MKWNRITKDRPCPVCGREKYCMVNDNGSAVLCTKVPSDKQVGEAGYLHVLDPERNEGWKPTELEQTFARYQTNVIFSMPQMLAEELGVTVESIEALRVGYYPGESAWVFAEMDANGNVIGLLKRHRKGRKTMVKGSNRGLMYARPLPRSDKPVIVVEGASDTLAAMDMGYVAVGRPSADGGGKMLQTLLNGRDVIVVGENDEAGRKGMAKIATVLQQSCPSVRTVLPPSQFKDLRQWHPNAAEFELHLEQSADTTEAARTIEEVNPYELAKRWLDDVYTKRGKRLLHSFRGNWFYYNGSSYDCIEASREKEAEIDNQLYPYLQSYNVIETRGKDVKVRNLIPRRSLIEDVKHALRALCFLKVNPDITEPFYINSKRHVDVARTVVFRNGMLDIETGVLHPLDPDIFVTSTLPFDYDPYARFDRWLGCIHEFFNSNENSMKLLAEWTGYNCIATNFMQQMMMLFGVRNSGKSTTLKVLQMLLGPERVCSFELSALNDKFGTSELVNKYAALISEDRQNTSADSNKVLSLIKKITGEDMVTVQRKYRDAHSVQLFSRFTYAGNELPIWNDDSRAIVRRFNLLYYPNDFVKQGKAIDRNLAAKLRQELPGIANWALDGLRRLLENGEFTRSEVALDHMKDFQDLSSPLNAMVDEFCEIDPGGFEPVMMLFDLHRQVYAEWGIKPMGLPLFRTRLRSAVPEISNGSKSVGGEMVRVYKGVRIKPNAKKRYLGRC